MTEVLEPSAAAAPTGTPAPDGLSAGAMLRQAREAAGLHVAAMAVSLKVPVGKLEALEQDRYDRLPDAAFARALASSVCRALKLDPRPVLERLPQTHAPRLIQDTDGINAPFRSPRDAVAPTWREQLTRPVTLVVGVLLLGAVVVLLLPRARTDEGSSPVAQAPAARPAAGPAPEVAKPAPAEAAVMPAQSASGAVAATGTAPTITASTATPPAAPAAAPALAAPSAATPASSASPASPASAVGGAVAFRASGNSWIEVRDAKGAVPLRKVLGAGDSASISGAFPLQVVVGNVKNTEVEVRGKRFDLQPVARDNVARFEIK